MTLRTEAAADYLSPTNSEIKDVAKRVGLNAYSPTLVRDIANLASGGRIRTSHEYRDELLGKNLEHVSVKQCSNGEYDFIEKEYTNSTPYIFQTESEDYAKAKEGKRIVKRNELVCEFLRNLDVDNLPGSTPLEQSVGLLYTLYTVSGKKYSTVGINDSCGETLPIFADNRGDKTGKFINDMNELVQSLNDDEVELLSEEDEESDTGSGHGSGITRIKLAQDMVNGAHHWLEVSRNLDSLVRFRLGNRGKPTPDIEGGDIIKRAINDFSEIGRMGPVEFLYPKTYRLARIANHVPLVRERVIREGKKQLIYMLLDCSYSMRSQNALHKCGGVLLNRLKAVLSDDAELYFRFFDDQLFPEYEVRTKQQAKDAIRTFKKNSFNGNGTDITHAIRKSIERIDTLMEDGKLSERPELVIVTDGDDPLVYDLKEEEFRKSNLRLHTFVVANPTDKNRYLAQLARATGGVGAVDL